MSPFYARAQKCWYLVRRLADADRPSDHMSRLRTFTAPLCSRAGAGDVVLAHLPPRLRSYLSEPAVAPLQKAALLLTTDKMREGAKGMEKGIGIGAAAIELLHQRNGGALMQGDPVRVVGGKHAGRHGYIIVAEPLTVANVHVRLEDERNYHQVSRKGLVFDPSTLLSTWRGITRGKDVFVKGLRNFDIQQVYHGLHERRRRLASHMACTSLIPWTG